AAARLDLRERRDQTPGGAPRPRPRLDLAALARGLCRWVWGALSRPPIFKSAMSGFPMFRSVRSRRLPSNAFDVHVIPEPEIFGMSHDPVRRPLGEPDFDHELRTRPVRTLIGDRARGERTRGRFQRTQEGGQARQLPLREPRTGVADADERAALPDAEQQCAEVRATSAAFREAADHAFLTARDLPARPRVPAPGRAGGGGALRGARPRPPPGEPVGGRRPRVGGCEAGGRRPRGARAVEVAPGAQASKLDTAIPTLLF